MKVTRYSGLKAASQCQGSVVVIDVLRAFTSAACAFDAGAQSIELVATPEEAWARRAADPELLLVGEHLGRKLEGFDFGNSPPQLHSAALRGRNLVLRSTAGTQGVVQAAQARRIVLGSLTVASATVRWLQQWDDEVSLLAMGSPSGPGEEDEACAELMLQMLLHQPVDRAGCLARVLASRAAAKALDPSVDWISPADLGAALALDRFDFAMPVHCEAGRRIARASRIER
jgi:2-phosphosulfolactate phosphatase